MKIAGLFAGIGGIETGLAAGLGSSETLLLCEWWAPARAVLSARFPDVDLWNDVADLPSLPEDVDLVSAGFPCTDLSQAGRTAGIQGTASGMVAHLFTMLDARHDRGARMPHVLIENVPNMLSLDRGRAMSYLVERLERNGYRWAYRTVDSRFTGLPQRRRRVIMLASTELDPAKVLFADDHGPRPDHDYASDAYGFYWTEGNRGVGWARDAVPTLKGSSTVGIPSPPAIWVPGGDEPFVVPHIEDAEALQGFAPGWTDVAFDGTTATRARGMRWKMIGNAVTTRVAAWVGQRLEAPGEVAVELRPHTRGERWPAAAVGGGGQVWIAAASEFPQHHPYEHLLEVVSVAKAAALSDKALRGFTFRLRRSNLRTSEGFLTGLEAECERRGIDLVAYGETLR